MAKRTMRMPAAPVTEEKMVESLKAYAAAWTKKAAMKARVNERIEKIKAAEAGEAAELEKTLDAESQVLFQWAQAHPERFKDLKKISPYGGHKIGWQLSPPAVSIGGTDPATKQRRTQAWFVDWCLANGKEEFLREVTEHSMNKEYILGQARLLKDAGDDVPDGERYMTDAAQEKLDWLRTMGVTVESSESFVIDLNLDVTE